MGDIFEVVFTGTYYSQLWQNKVHFERVEGAPTAQSVALGLKEKWVFWMRQMQVSDVLWVNLQVKRLSGLQDIHVEPLAVTGAQAQETQRASFICGVMRKHTGLAGRANRGRLHIPGIRGGATQFGRIVASELALWNGVFIELKPFFFEAFPYGVRLVIKHPEGSTPVTSMSMRDILGSMRTRNIGVGA